VVWKILLYETIYSQLCTGFEFGMDDVSRHLKYS